MNGYGSEMDAGPPFFWEAVGHKHGLMLHRIIMWRDRYSATGCSPALQAVDSKQAENLSVGKTKSYWTNALLTALKKWTFNLPMKRAASGRHVFEANVNRFALILQVHGTKPLDDLAQ